MADEKFGTGDHVTRRSHGGTADGTVRDVITEDAEAAGRTPPRTSRSTLVESEKSAARPSTSRARSRRAEHARVPSPASWSHVAVRDRGGTATGPHEAGGGLSP
jgi:hypothetical protein